MLFFATALALVPQLPTPRAAPRAAPPTMLGGAPPQQHLQRTALAALAAAVLVAASMDAEAARSGGRMGGRAPAMRSAPMRSAPMRGGGGYGGGYGGGRTNVYVSPGIGMGMSPFGYGYGYGISPGAYLGLTLAETLLREQQRQAYLEQQLRTQQQLGQDQAMIQQLRTMLHLRDRRGTCRHRPRRRSLATTAAYLLRGSRSDLSLRRRRRARRTQGRAQHMPRAGADRLGRLGGRPVPPHRRVCI